MPKRSFSELDGQDLLVQSKIHVGQKEVDRGISSATAMKAVYKKTLDLLFQRSKRVTTEEAQVPHLQGAPSKHCQMTLTPNGLLRPGKPDLIMDVNVAGMASGCRCPSCQTTNVVMHERCLFCDQFVCSDCLHSCRGCGGDFCPKCSMNLYAKDESRMCFTCASNRGHL